MKTSDSIRKKISDITNTLINNGKSLPEIEFYKLNNELKKLSDELSKQIDEEGGIIGGYILDMKEMLFLGKTWQEIFCTKVFYDNNPSSHAFINLLEDIFHVQIKSANQIQKLTKIDISLLDELEDTLTCAREDRYLRFLMLEINNGKKFNELQEIKPEQFDLPNKWKLLSHKGELRDEEAVLDLAIMCSFPERERSNLTVMDIVKILEAPRERLIKIFDMYGEFD